VLQELSPNAMTIAERRYFIILLGKNETELDFRQY